MPRAEAIVYLGIDPGLGTTGYGVVEYLEGNPRLLDAGVIRSSADDMLARRLDELFRGLVEVMGRFSPEAMGIEELYSHYRHPITAVRMAHARGVLCLAAVQNGVRPVELPATRIKKLVTGNGRAPKEQVAGMVGRLLGIRGEIRPNDVTDALAVAIAAYESDMNDRKLKRIGRGHG